MNRLDSTQFYIDKAYALAREKKLSRHIGLAIRNFGIIQFKKGNFNKAIDFYNQSLAQKASQNNHNYMSEDLRLKAEVIRNLVRWIPAFSLPDRPMSRPDWNEAPACRSARRPS